MATATAPSTHPVPSHALKKAWKRALVITLLLAAALGAFTYLRSRKKTAAPAFRFETATAARGPLQARITASGTLSALVTVQVGSQVSGRVQKLNADFNSEVRKGQVVAQLDPNFYRAALQQAQANRIAARGNRLKAEAQLAQAELDARRNRDLLAQKLISASQADQTDTALKVAVSSLEAAKGAEAQAQAALDQARINLDYTTIISPIDGVVISRNVDVGQTVAAALQAPTLFTIAQDLQQMQVDTNIAEADVGHLARGMPASFTVDAYPGEQFKGVIREVRNAPQTVQNVVTYDAVIDVPNPALKLKPGMTANVSVVYADRTDALKVPNAALRFRASPELTARFGAAPEAKGDKRVVWVMSGAEPKPRTVKVGFSDGTQTEILEGVEAGEKLVTEAVYLGPKTGGFRMF